MPSKDQCSQSKRIHLCACLFNLVFFLGHVIYFAIYDKALESIIEQVGPNVKPLLQHYYRTLVSLHIVTQLVGAFGAIHAQLALVYIYFLLNATEIALMYMITYAHWYIELCFVVSCATAINLMVELPRPERPIKAKIIVDDVQYCFTIQIDP